MEESYILGFDPGGRGKFGWAVACLNKDGHPNNFITFKPKKNFVVVGIRLARDEEVTKKLENCGLDLMDYSIRSGRYRIRISPGEVKKNLDILREVIGLSHKECGN